MFREERKKSLFSWSDIGDIEVGRPHLGPDVPVAMYRLFQYTLRDILIRDHGVEEADRLFREAGTVAGASFCEHVIGTKHDFNGFIAAMTHALKEHRVGILRIEEADLQTMHFTMTVAEDLDCAGLPVSNEAICAYDEGFIAGILGLYTKRPFTVEEIDCWATGDRVCRFEAYPRTES
jgi:uncharacterized protein